MPQPGTGVYRLETFRFLKKYKRFLRSDPTTFPDFHTALDANGTLRPPRLAGRWKTPSLIGEVWPENDFPGEGVPAALTPVFSPRAVDGLRDLLEPNGELLPVQTPLGTYYAYNLLTVADVLDKRKSRVEWRGGSRTYAFGTSRYAFKIDALKGLAIFRLPQLPREIHVTAGFVDRVKALELNGFWIIKIWPLPRGVDWTTAWNAALEQMKREAATAPATPRRSTPPAKQARAPRTLDLRADVPKLVKFLARVVKLIERKQRDWAAIHQERVTVIGLDLTGWGALRGPEVICNVDTRARHRADGVWSRPGLLSMSFPRWGAMATALEDPEHERDVIDVNGQCHSLRGHAPHLGKWFEQTLVGAVRQACKRELFASLIDVKRLKVGVSHWDRGYWWSMPAMKKR